MIVTRLLQAIVYLVAFPILFSTTFLVLFAYTGPSMPPIPAGPYPGDNIIGDAVMVYDQARLINALPSAVWPWVLQVGKGRGGWYTPKQWEWVLPRSWHATRSINPEYQKLQPGDRIDDYGFSADDYFIVSEVQPEKALVYKSDRYGAHFSWALILHEMKENDATQTLLHLRFRGKIAATGLKKSLIVTGGGIMDHVTTAPMLTGLQERAEAHYSNTTQKSS